MANMPKRGAGDCYCQKSKGLNIYDYTQKRSSWISCPLYGLTDTHNAYFPDGCSSKWLQTTQFFPYEKYAGSASTPAECVRMVQRKCPGWDMASTYNVTWGPNNTTNNTSSANNSSNANNSSGNNTSGPPPQGCYCQRSFGKPLNYNHT